VVYSSALGWQPRSGDQLSETGSRPAFLDEFERKLAAALARQPDARKTRIASARSSDASVPVPSSPSLDEASAPSSVSEEPPEKVEQPSSETRGTRAQLSNPKPRRLSPQGDSANGAASAPAASGTGDVRAAQPAAERSDQAEISLEARALKLATRPSRVAAKQLSDSAKVDQAVADEAMTAEAVMAILPELPLGDGDEPTQEIGAAPGPLESKARQTVDVEALLADDAEVVKVVKPANLHAHSKAEASERPSRNWKLMALACALVGAAIIGAVALPRGMLALPNTPLRADMPSARETTNRNDLAEQALQDPALEASTAAKDRLGASSQGVVTNEETPRAGATQLTSNLTVPTFPPAPPLQASGVEPTRTDLPATATSTAVPPAQPSDLNLVPADLAATPPSSVAPPMQPSGIEPVPTDQAAIATPPLAPRAQTSDVKDTPAISPPLVPIPTSTTLPIGASSADQATKPDAAEGPSQSLPDGGMKGGVASNLAQPGTELSAADPGASARGAAVEKPVRQPVGHDHKGGKRRGAQTAPASAAAATTPAAPIQLNGLY
jgi:hypothetical protein